jgi:hypothetical protein
MIPLPIPLLFLHNFLPIFLYDFIRFHMEIVYGMVIWFRYWCYGLVMIGRDIHYRRGSDMGRVYFSTGRKSLE